MRWTSHCRLVRRTSRCARPPSPPAGVSRSHSEPLPGLGLDILEVALSESDEVQQHTTHCRIDMNTFVCVCVCVCVCVSLSLSLVCMCLLLCLLFISVCGCMCVLSVCPYARVCFLCTVFLAVSFVNETLPSESRLFSTLSDSVELLSDRN